jgi:hypothetical protein
MRVLGLYRAMQKSSWPGLSRPSTSSAPDSKDVDARNKSAQDDFQLSLRIPNLHTLSLQFPPTALRLRGNDGIACWMSTYANLCNVVLVLRRQLSVKERKDACRRNGSCQDFARNLDLRRRREFVSEPTR